MGKRGVIKDKLVFVVMCAILIAAFLGWKGCDMKFGGLGNGRPNNNQRLEKQDKDRETDAGEENPEEVRENRPAVSVVKLYLGRRGVSADRITWYDADRFAGYIRQLKENGIREVHYTLLPDSIERYEEKWAEELKKANMRSYIETD